MMRAAAVCFVLAAALACNRKPEAADRHEPEAAILGPEDVARVEVGEVLTGALLSGELQAARTATVRAQMGGSVSGVRASDGTRVARGEVLAQIRAVSEREAVSSARAAVTTAQTELDNALRDAERTRILVKAGALAQRDLDQAETIVAGARARLAEARASLASASERLEDTVVRAPISGVVSDAAVDSGDIVAVGAEMFTIIDPSTLELYASVAAENMAALRTGTPIEFQVQGYPGRTFRGTIRRVSPSVNPQTRQVDVYASIPNDSGLLIAGLYASGRIATGEREAIVVPADAIVTSGNENAVLKVHDENVVRQPVELGSRDESTGRVQVRTGLQAGDVVLVGPATALRPGTPVEFRQVQGKEKK